MKSMKQASNNNTTDTTALTKAQKILAKAKSHQAWLLDSFKRTYAILNKYYLKQAEAIEAGTMLIDYKYRSNIKDYHMVAAYIAGSKYVTEANLKNAPLVIQLYDGSVMDPTPIGWLHPELIREVLIFCNSNIEYLEGHIRH